MVNSQWWVVSGPLLVVKMKGVFIYAALLAAIFFGGAAAGAAPCQGKGIEVQVLGSGGPETGDKRASSSYLIWLDGRAAVLVDSGGGSALRFGQSGARMQDLDLVLFTHFHADHSADFPALVKSSFFEDRTRPLLVYGPSGNLRFPAAGEFIRALFDEKTGAFRYLYDFITPGAASYLIQTHDVDATEPAVRAIYSDKHLQVSAVAVVHGPVPALAWRVEADGRSVVFSGDTNGSGDALSRLARGADLFIAHNAVPEGATGVARNLHMPPSVIGRIAAGAKVKQLVLSHRMLRTLGREEETLRYIRKNFFGPVSFADDLDCYGL